MKLGRTQKLAGGGLIAIVISLFYLYLLLPFILKRVVKKKVALKKGWPMREIWSKLPFVMECHVYMFNITNHLDIVSGAKPIIEEVGPFVYDIYHEKVDQIDYEEDDTVSYIPRNHYYFNEFKSNGLSDEVEVYYPHPFIMAASNIMKKNQREPLNLWTSKGIDVLLNTPESAFFRVKARDALFDGMKIECGSAKDYFARIVCAYAYENTWRVLVSSNGTLYISTLGWLNGTHHYEKRIRIKRGIKKLKDLGKIVSVEDKYNLDTWNNTQCDSFAGGTDGSIFPPFMRGKRDIVIVNAGACRKILLTYRSSVKFSGLKLLRYVGDLGSDGDHIPGDKCYCITEDTCLKKGMFETKNCLQIPLIASNPHFYRADPYYLTTVDTLKPDKDKHGLYIDFDPLTGIPVRVHQRVQFNWELYPIERFRLARNYTNAMLPFIWLDQIVELPESMIGELKNAHFLTTISKDFGYLMMIAGLATIGFAVHLDYKERIRVRELKLKIAKLHESGSNDVDERKAKIRENLRAAPVPTDFRW